MGCCQLAVNKDELAVKICLLANRRREVPSRSLESESRLRRQRRSSNNTFSQWENQDSWKNLRAEISWWEIPFLKSRFLKVIALLKWTFRGNLFNGRLEISYDASKAHIMRTSYREVAICNRKYSSHGRCLEIYIYWSEFPSKISSTGGRNESTATPSYPVFQSPANGKSRASACRVFNPQGRVGNCAIEVNKG